MNQMAEQSIIGALLMDINSVQGIYDDMKPEMFEIDILSRAYFEIIKAYDMGEPVSLVNLCQWLEEAGYGSDVTFGTIKGCVENTVTSATIRSSADVLINNYKAKMLSRIINSVQIMPSSIDGTIGALLNDLEALVRSEKSKLKPMGQIVKENQDQYFVDLPDTGVKFGFSRLDEMIGSLEGGDITIIGARPAVGKSAFVTQVITNMAQSGKKVAFYNLEMMDKQVYERMLSGQTGIGLKRIRRAKNYLNDEQGRVSRANEVLSGLNVWISSGPKKISEIRNECRHNDFDVIVIDYLQLLRADTWYSNRAAEVGAISKAMKGLAMEINTPIVVLSQLNRQSEARETKEPTMAELRESGDIEQDASNILLMWNTSKMDGGKKAVKIEKQRQGETGKVAMRFSGSIMRFEETGEPVREEEFCQAKEPTPFD